MNYMVEGSCDALITTIRAKVAPVRIGIDIQKEEAKIGLIDIHRKLLAFEKVNLESCGSFDIIFKKIGECAVALLDKQGIPMDQCIGAGVGIPEISVKRNGAKNLS